MIAETDLLGGGFGGLWGEVVTEDVYRLRQVPFAPDVVFDIGANIGVFAQHARNCFPDAVIVCVEPHPANFEILTQRVRDEKTILIWAALGNGKPLFRVDGARNGTGESYLSAGLGFPQEMMAKAAGFVAAETPTVTLPKLFKEFSSPDQRRLLKLDCEGAENSIWTDLNSMEVLRGVDYIAAELHFYALHGGLVPEVKERTLHALASLGSTHNCELRHVHFWATRTV